MQYFGDAVPRADVVKVFGHFPVKAVRKNENASNMSRRARRVGKCMQATISSSGFWWKT
jgi:hypothetical protein